ncbi:MAG: osmoprotectant ABC transporter substrate-binding protein [Lactobacillaceae bacterium]|jgi:osmoprotectant transport system substrate-binding protein|nr:osmoprotectant ABC transporter substrate-binding protein [Lactobacillaceae bacterium]
MNIKKKWVLSLLAIASVLVLLFSQGQFLNLTNKENAPIKIATVNTTESQIMGNIVSELITHETGLATTQINNLGSSSVVHQAMLSGDADISATRYTGTEIAATLKLPAILDRKRAQRVVTNDFKQQFKQTWFKTYGFSNTYVLLVTQATATKYNLKNVSDLARVSNKLSMAVDSSWYEKKGDGYQAFAKKYQTHFNQILPMQIGLVYPSLVKGDVNVAMGYSTDSRIMSNKLVMLKDDLRFFPAYDTSMVVNDQLLKEHSQLNAVLNRLDGKIDLQMIQNMNYQVDHQGIAPETVAHQFLQKHDYFREVHK